MNEEERKAWEEMVGLCGIFPRCTEFTAYLVDQDAILAADAELTRLREALYKGHNDDFDGRECMCDDCESYRRRAKAGK